MWCGMLSFEFFILMVILLHILLNNSTTAQDVYLNLLEGLFHYAKTSIIQRKQANEYAERLSQMTERESACVDGQKRANDEENEMQHCPCGNVKTDASGRQIASMRMQARTLNAPNRHRTFNRKMQQCCELISQGIGVIAHDKVTPRFISEQLEHWNLLSRNIRNYCDISYPLMIIWLLGCVVRYMVLLPIRLIISVFSTLWLAVCALFLASLPVRYVSPHRKRSLTKNVLQHCFRMMSTAMTAVFHFHNVQYRPMNGICVANHTTPLDVLVLMCDGNYSLIGQKHNGFLGFVQRLLARVYPHIWFERTERKDRQTVTENLRLHVAVSENPPTLIFPEGTCINNTAVMQFKKGCFEVTNVIHPIAIKYDPRFGDAFWNSSRYSILHYIYKMITSWTIVCNIWYMPPMFRYDGESAIDFASRVKAAIAKQAGLENLDWDGNLKRMDPTEPNIIEYVKRFRHLEKTKPS